MATNECYQHKVKMKHQKEDLVLFNLTKEAAKNLSISDLNFEVVQKEDLHRVEDVIKFIEKYEWLGIINRYWNFAFCLTYQEKIVCCVMIGTPQMGSKLLGENTKELEQVIHRGASCSIAPKNSGSFLISNAIEWMVNNSPYRLFYGYSTTEGANEYGYIYQSLNAILVSDKAGNRMEYLKPGTENKWLSDRHLRKLSNYKKQARKLGIEWDLSWHEGWKVIWDNIPDEIEQQIRQQVKDDMKNLKFRKVHPKLKYLIIKGKDKRETKKLRNLFKELNPKLIKKDGTLGLPYPKKGGLHNER